MRKIARSVVLAVVLAMVLAAALVGAATGAQAALNGTLYAVVSPLYDGSNGSTSFLRLYGGTASATSTFGIRVVDTTTGANMGGLVTIPVPKYASPQFSFDTILAMAGAAKTATHAYSLYIQNPEATAGYQHVTFNGQSALFENNSVCAHTLNQAMTAAHPSLVLTNLHTSGPPSLTNYPIQVEIHNYWNAAVSYGVYVYDAGTADAAGTIRAGSGAVVGTKLYTVSANASLSLSFSQIQQDIGWTPNPATQLHANMIVTEAGNHAPTEVLSAVVVNNQLGGTANMSFACAVNAPPPPSTGGGSIGGGISGAYLSN